MDGSNETVARRAVLAALGPNADRHTVEQLLDLFVLRSNKDSPLHLALSMRKLEACRALLAEGADPNVLSHGKSPVYVAAETGQDDALRMLFEAGADKEPHHLAKPLFRACEMAHANVARTLLAEGATANARLRAPHSTLLLLAATSGHAGVVEALLEHGALHATTDRWTQFPMYVAAGEGHVAVLRALIDADADVNQQTNALSTPLHSAAFGGHAPAVNPHTLHLTSYTQSPTP